MATKNTGKKEKGAYGLPKGSYEVPAWQETVGTALSGQAEIDEVDKVAIEMERKWGRDRLRLIVGPDLREKFDRQRYLLNQAIWHGDLQTVIAEAKRMATAWKVLDRKAEEAGAKPLDPLVWELVLPKTGTVVAIVRDGEAGKVVADGRYVDVYELSEIGHLLEGFPDLVKAKNHFPGATVTAVRSRITDPLERVPDSRVGIDEAYEHQRGPIDAVPF
jgi:hypothetical protein